MQQDHQLSVQNVNFLHEVLQIQLKQELKGVIKSQLVNPHFENGHLEMRASYHFLSDVGQSGFSKPTILELSPTEAKYCRDAMHFNILKNQIEKKSGGFSS